MSEWRLLPLGEVCELKRGYDLPAKHRHAGAVPIVSSSGISGFHDEVKVNGPGVVTGRYGTLGEVFYVEGGFWPLNTSLYVRDFKGNDPRFIALLLRSMNLSQYDGAAAVPGLNRNQLHTVPVRVPGLTNQRAISAVDACLGDLIENNRRRIELLESMARAIYREWFVHFRFPGHEDAPMVDSDLGPIPEGWTASSLNEIAQITMGQSPKSEYYNSEGIGKPFHQGVSEFGNHYPTTRKWCSVEGRSADAGDILVSVRAPVGRINVADVDLTIGRGLAALRSRSGHRALLLAHLRHIFAEEDSMGGGTIFNAVGKAELSGIRVVQPSAMVAAKANDILRSNQQQILTLTHLNRTLSTMRDLLLPKLVSGEIDVSGLDLDSVIDKDVVISNSEAVA